MLRARNTGELKQIINRALGEHLPEGRKELLAHLDKYATYSYKELVRDDTGNTFYDILSTLLLDLWDKAYATNMYEETLNGLGIGAFTVLIYPYIEAHYGEDKVYASVVKASLLRAVTRIFMSRNQLDLDMEKIVEAFVKELLNEPATESEYELLINLMARMDLDTKAINLHLEYV